MGLSASWQHTQLHHCLPGHTEALTLCVRLSVVLLLGSLCRQQPELNTAPDTHTHTHNVILNRIATLSVGYASEQEWAMIF